MNRKLIITADDYNGDPLINSAIHKAIEAGVVTTVTAFSNTQGAQNHLKFLSSTYGHQISIGAHLSISSGFAFTGALMDKNVKLNPSTQRYDFVEFGDLCINTVNPSHLEQEIHAQLSAFTEAGIEIDHISVHQGTLLLHQEWLNVLMGLAKSFYPHRTIPIRAFLRASQIFPILIRDAYDADLMNRQIASNATRLALKNGIATLKLLKNKKYFKQNTILASQYNIGMPNPLIDSFYGDPSPLNLSRILYNLPHTNYDPHKGRFVKTDQAPVFELMVHLADGIPSHTMNGISKDYFRQRIVELNTLTEHLPALMADFKIDLAHFKDLA